MASSEKGDKSGRLDREQIRRGWRQEHDAIEIGLGRTADVAAMCRRRELCRKTMQFG